jgi:transposase
VEANIKRGENRMQLKTILNRVQRHGSFVYESARFREGGIELALEIDIRPRLNGQAVCSGCDRRIPGYDTLSRRRFEFVPLWGMRVFFWYAMRRVDCPRCGVVVEKVPWSDGKSQLTTTYAWFLARWAKVLSWTQVAEIFRASWDSVFRAVEMAVTWGREHQDLGGIESIGVDEIQWQRGHKYLTLVYQIDPGCRRLLWIGRERTTATLEGFFDWLGKRRSALLKYVCSDMWQPYLKVIAERAAQAVHVLDRYHIVAKLSKAMSPTRPGLSKSEAIRDMAALPSLSTRPT